jgi:polo-like kinase 4
VYIIGLESLLLAQLVKYNDDIKCSLMCNGAHGDIELLFFLPTAHPSLHGLHAMLATEEDTVLKSKDVQMRIRLSRERSFVEIVRLVLCPSARGTEWTKKTLVLIPGMTVPECDWSNLDGVEASGLQRALEFLAICQAVEATEARHRTTSGSSKQPFDFYTVHHRGPRRQPRTSSTLPMRTSLETDGSPMIAAAPIRHRRRRTSSRELGLNGSAQSFLSRFNSRFIPNVGWCIRHDGVGHDTQGARYTIMFLDGVTLDVDVDEEWVELKSVSGETTR